MTATGKFTSADGRLVIDLDKFHIAVDVPETEEAAARRSFAMAYVWPHFAPVTILQQAWLCKGVDKVRIAKSFVRELRQFAKGLNFEVSDKLISHHLWSTLGGIDNTTIEAALS